MKASGLSAKKLLAFLKKSGLVFYYPINFDIISKNIYSKIKQLNNDIELKNKEELHLVFNNGKIRQWILKK